MCSISVSDPKVSFTSLVLGEVTKWAVKKVGDWGSGGVVSESNGQIVL